MMVRVSTLKPKPTKDGPGTAAEVFRYDGIDLVDTEGKQVRLYRTAYTDDGSLTKVAEFSTSEITELLIA